MLVIFLSAFHLGLLAEGSEEAGSILLTTATAAVLSIRRSLDCFDHAVVQSDC